MLLQLIPFLLMLFANCTTPSETAQIKVIREDNRDVLALSYLIRDYMCQTNNTDFTLSDIKKYDTLGRVTNNFSKLIITDWPDIWAGGYAVYFKFSDNRNKELVKLTESENIPRIVKTNKNIGRNNEQLSQKFDGEIHFYYPERHYHIVEIILRNIEN